MSGINLSYTANDKYRISPRSWYLHYVRKLRPQKLGSPLFFGGEVDTSLGHMLKNKFRPKSEQIDPIKRFEAGMRYNRYNGQKIDLRTSKDVKFSKADLDKSLWVDEDFNFPNNYSPEWITLRRKGLMMLEAYRQQVLPHIKELHSVQQYVNIPNDEGDRIIGYIDFYAKFELDESVEFADLSLKQYNGMNIIFDNKTSSVAYKEDSVRTSAQLGTYFENPELAVQPQAAGYIIIPKKFRKKKLPLIPIKIIIDKVDPEVVDSIFEAYNDTLKGIKMGDFPCTGCRENVFGCPYAKYCDSDGQNLEGLVYVKKDR